MATLYNNRNVIVLLVFADGDKIELGPGTGDESIGEISAGGRAAVKILNRGAFIGMVETEDQEVSFSITLHLVGPITSDSTGRPLDALLKTNFYEGKQTVDPAGVVHTGNIEVLGTRSTGDSYQVSLYNVRFNVASASSPEGNSLTVSGIAYGDGVHLPVVYS